MADMSVPDRLQSMLELKQVLDQHLAQAQAKLDEIGNLSAIGGERAASIARSVKAANTMLTELRKVTSGPRGMGRKLDLWKAHLADLGLKIG